MSSFVTSSLTLTKCFSHIETALKPSMYDVNVSFQYNSVPNNQNGNTNQKTVVFAIDSSSMSN